MSKVEGRDFEVVTDRAVVWVNSADGMCVGRFSERGVDVHRTADEQMQGMPECLDCVHDLPPAEAWARFQASMESHHGIVIGPEWAPDYVRRPETHGAPFLAAA